MYDKSFDYYEKALPFLPDKIRSTKEIANLFLSDTAYESAIKMLTKYIEYAPKNPDAYLRRADVYFAINDFVKAKNDYEKVIELDSQNKYVKAKLIEIYEELKNR